MTKYIIYLSLFYYYYGQVWRCHCQSTSIYLILPVRLTCYALTCPASHALTIKPKKRPGLPVCVCHGPLPTEKMGVRKGGAPGRNYRLSAHSPIYCGTMVLQLVQRLPDMLLCIRTLAAGANKYCCSLQVPLVHVQLHRGKEL